MAFTNKPSGKNTFIYKYCDFDDFVNRASNDEIVEFNKSISQVTKILECKNNGYRILSNIGIDGGQEVPHLHYHIFAGEKIGKMISR